MILEPRTVIKVKLFLHPEQEGCKFCLPFVTKTSHYTKTITNLLHFYLQSITCIS